MLKSQLTRMSSMIVKARRMKIPRRHHGRGRDARRLSLLILLRAAELVLAALSQALRGGAELLALHLNAHESNPR